MREVMLKLSRQANAAPFIEDLYPIPAVDNILVDSD